MAEMKKTTDVGQWTCEDSVFVLVKVKKILLITVVHVIFALHFMTICAPPRQRKQKFYALMSSSFVNMTEVNTYISITVTAFVLICQKEFRYTF